MNANLVERFRELPDFLGGHLFLSISALTVGILVSVPLGLWASRKSRAGGLALGIAGIIQTVPSLALLALMVPLLGGTIGYLPAFLALTLYSILPILQNTVTGIRDVDPAMIEAAQGVGMTPMQQLTRVELPLAAPVIIAGIRTATVWVVGMTTLSTPVGAPSLGNYIFAGLQTRNWVAVLFGCVLAALLAIVLDRLIRIAEKAAKERRPHLAWGAGSALALVIVVGLAPLVIKDWRAAREPGARAADGATPLSGVRLTVGSKTFTEQYILAELLEQRLASLGATVGSAEDMGSTLLFDALSHDQVDLYVDYTGTIWSTLMKRDAPIPRDAMYGEVADFVHRLYGVVALGRLGFENAYGFAMRRDHALQLGIRSIGDIARQSTALVLGGDPEFFFRPDWIRVREIYGLGSLRTRTMDSTFMYGAVRDGEVDVIGAYTTDGRIAAFDLVVLDDPLEALPPYDAILLLSPRAAQNAALIEALRPLIGAIDDDAMREANRRVDLEGQSPKTVAKFLSAAQLGD